MKCLLLGTDLLQDFTFHSKYLMDRNYIVNHIRTHVGLHKVDRNARLHSPLEHMVPLTYLYM